MGTFYIEVDWDGTGYTTEAAARLKSFVVRRGKNSSVSSNTYTEVDTGEANITVSNGDGRYSIFNASSPIYNYLRPNKKIRIVYDDGAVKKNIFTGYISNIVNFRDTKTARIECLDGIEFLKRRKGDDVGLQTNYLVNNAMYDILGTAGYPSSDGTDWIFPITFPANLGGSSIENNGDTIPYFWGQSGESVWDQLVDLSRAFAGDCYVDADGVFNYAARGKLRASVATITNSDLQADTQPEQPWSEIKNSIKVIARPLSLTAANSEIYRMSDTPLLTPGQSVTVWAEYSYQGQVGPATSVTTPVATTDYTANTISDGSGSDRTSSLGVTFTAYTTRSKVVMTNNGSDNLYVTLFKIRGTMLYNINETAQIAEDVTSRTNYERRELSVQSPYMQEVIEAYSHALHSLAIYKDARKVLWAKLLNRTDTQTALDLFDVVTLDNVEWGVSGDYRVTRIEHDFSPRTFLSVFRLEPQVDVGWTFPMTFPTWLGW